MLETSPSSRRTVLVVSDGRRGPTATQKISFGQPFDTGEGDDLFSVVYRQTEDGIEQVQAALAEHRPEYLILSRSTSPLGKNWIQAGRSAGIPVIFHIDDDLLAVPASLGEAKHASYNDPVRLDALRSHMERCDIVYVSTGPLGRRLKEHGVRTPIFAGEIYCSVDPDQIGALAPPATGPVIGYMGTGGHAADLASILPAICEAMEEVPTLQMELFGTIQMPAELIRFGRRVRHLPPVADYSAFIHRLRTLGWWVGMAPLEDNSFNRCKANTKWVEYGLAGIAVIASALPVYEDCCAEGAGRLAASPHEWKRAVLELISDAAARTSLIETAQARLRARFTHERLRNQLGELFETVSPRARD